MVCGADSLGYCLVDQQLWRNSWSITGQTHEKLTSIQCLIDHRHRITTTTPRMTSSEKWILFYQRNLGLSWSNRYASGSRNVLRLNMHWHVQFQMERIRKICRRLPRSVNDAELGHFTLLFCRGRQRNVQVLITHVHGYCFVHKPFVQWRYPCRCHCGVSLNE